MTTQEFTIIKNGQSFEVKIEQDDEECTLWMFVKDANSNWIRSDEKGFSAPFRLSDIPKSWGIKNGEIVNI